MFPDGPGNSTTMKRPLRRTLVRSGNPFGSFEPQRKKKQRERCAPFFPSSSAIQKSFIAALVLTIKTQ